MPWSPTGEVPSRSVWTGDELIVISGEAAAYNPATNQWRRLADPPEARSGLVWTGQTILTTIARPDRGATSLVGYDVSADMWHTVDDEVSYHGYALVAVPDASGVARGVVALSDDSGAVTVLDAAGNAIGTLPDHPDGAAKFGTRLDVIGIWTGEEALFWIRSTDLLPSQRTEEAWALNPETGTWRQLDADDSPPSDDLKLVADAGVLVGWGGVAEDETYKGGIAYRAP